ncbi:MAG: glucose-1-phosphate adenylyltransferase [Alphaproteobacteria bacterium]|jgi:glucose-1-phosphate adenylyltransferase
MADKERTNTNHLANDTLVILLAGGQGSRLHELTESRAKPSLEFGGGCRIIDFPLSNCVNSGFKQIGVVTQYKAQCLIRHLVTTWTKFNQNFGEFLELLPASQQHSEQWYKGTADSLFQNIDFIKSVMPKYVLVLGGDHIYKMDYRDILDKHIKSGAAMTVSCIETPLQDAAGQFGIVNVDSDDVVVAFEEKPIAPSGLPDKPNHVLASMGNYVFNTNFLIEQLQKDAVEQSSFHDFGKDIIPSILTEHKVQAFRFRESNNSTAAYWRDVGTLDAYWDANMALLADQPSIDLCDTKWPIWSTTACLQPARFVGSHSNPAGQVSNSLISAGCVINPSEISNSLIFEHSIIEINAHISRSVLMPNVQVGKNVVIKRAIVDHNCIIPDGLQIGVNSKDDIRRGFRISAGGVVLVTQEMLKNSPIQKPKDFPKQKLSDTDLLERNSKPVKLKDEEVKIWM